VQARHRTAEAGDDVRIVGGIEDRIEADRLRGGRVRHSVIRGHHQVGAVADGQRVDAVEQPSDRAVERTCGLFDELVLEVRVV